jgi:ActR/RegA family two-component response regulator
VQNPRRQYRSEKSAAWNRSQSTRVAIKQCEGNVSQAADLFHLGRITLIQKLDKQQNI